jgi:peptidoglycan/LPS O-acetylase OafA/YrhL
MDVLPLRSQKGSAPRLNVAGFDAVRAGATFGVVLLHSCVPYLQHPMPGLAWPVRDVASAWVDFGFWTIELFIMPLFLVMSGFLAWRTLQRQGGWNLVRSRAGRLLKPLLFGAVVVLPLDLYAWVLGWVCEGSVAAVKLRSLKFDGQMDRDLWGLSHLWYLQYLFLYVACLAGAVFVSHRWRIAKRVAIGPRLVTALVLCIGTLVLSWRPEVVWGFQHSFAPVPSKWLYSGLFFAFGAMLAAHDEHLEWLMANVHRLLVPTALFGLSAVLLGRWHLSGGEGEQVLARITLALLTCVAAAMLSLSILGSVCRRVDRVSLLVQYAAAASFWIYLVHHPIVGLVHIDLKWLMPQTSPAWKTAIAFAVTSGLCLLTYEGLVRRTALGSWLGLSWMSMEAEGQAGSVLSVETAAPSRPQEDEAAQPERRRAA